MAVYNNLPGSGSYFRLSLISIYHILIVFYLECLYLLVYLLSISFFDNIVYGIFLAFNFMTSNTEKCIFLM